MAGDEHARRVHRFLRNWAFVIGMFLTICALVAIALLVVTWPMIAAFHFGYSDTDVLTGETVWTYVQLVWGFLLVTTGTALMMTMHQVRSDD